MGYGCRRGSWEGDITQRKMEWLEKSLLAVWGTVRHRKLGPLQSLANELYCHGLGQIRHGAFLVYQIVMKYIEIKFCQPKARGYFHGVHTLRSLDP